MPPPMLIYNNHTTKMKYRSELTKNNYEVYN